MEIFLDANILVSVLNKEYPLFTYTSRIVSLADTPGFTLYTSPICLAIAFYFAEKKYRSIAKNKIAILCEHIHITPVVKSTVLRSLQNRVLNDFEDGIEYYSAIDSKCNCIITEDIHDFYFSKIDVLNSESFFEKYLFDN